MTVGELINNLQQFDKNLKVFIEDTRKTPIGCFLGTPWTLKENHKKYFVYIK